MLGLSNAPLGSNYQIKDKLSTKSQKPFLKYINTGEKSRNLVFHKKDCNDKSPTHRKNRIPWKKKENKMFKTNNPHMATLTLKRNSFTWRPLGRKPGQSYWILLPMESAACIRAVFCFVRTNSCFLSFPFLKDSRKGGCL